MRKKKGVFKICSCCKSEFYVPKYREESASFCSVKCLNSNQYEKYKINCLDCKKEMIVSNSRRKTKFCSEYCRHNAKKTIIENRKDARLSARISRGKFTGKTLRKFVFSKKQIKCEMCGYDEFDFCIDVHHIDNNPLNNDISNLQVLCVICHRCVHKGLKNAIN